MKDTRHWDPAWVRAMQRDGVWRVQEAENEGKGNARFRGGQRPARMWMSGESWLLCEVLRP